MTLSGSGSEVEQKVRIAQKPLLQSLLRRLQQFSTGHFRFLVPIGTPAWPQSPPGEVHLWRRLHEMYSGCVVQLRRYKELALTGRAPGIFI